MFGPSVPVIVIFNDGCANRAPAAPRHKHKLTIDFNKSDDILPMMALPCLVRGSTVKKKRPNYDSLRDLGAFAAYGRARQFYNRQYHVAARPLEG